MTRTLEITLRAAGLILALATILMIADPAVAAGEQPTTPSDFRVDVGSSSVTVEWEPSRSDAEIVIYHVRLSDQHHWTVEPSITFYLDRSTTYQLTVQAQDGAHRRSDWSDPVEFTTPDAFPVTTPGNVQVTDAPGTLTVAWEPSSSAAGVMDYLAVVHGTKAGDIGKRTSGTTATFDVPPGGDLEVTVSARDNRYRWSDTSDPVPVAVPPADDWQPPSAPTNLRAMFDAQGRVTLAWDAAAGGSGTLRYAIILVEYDNTAIEYTHELHKELLSDFGACPPNPREPLTLVVTAASHGFVSPPSEPVTLCFV